MALPSPPLHHFGPARAPRRLRHPHGFVTGRIASPFIPPPLPAHLFELKQFHRNMDGADR